METEPGLEAFCDEVEGGSEGETYRVPKTCLGRREKRQRLASRSGHLVGSCSRRCDCCHHLQHILHPTCSCSRCISCSISSFFPLFFYPPLFLAFPLYLCTTHGDARKIERATHQKSYVEWKGGIDSSQLYPAIWRRRSNSRGGGGGRGSSTSSGTRAGPSMMARSHRKKRSPQLAALAEGRCSASFT